LHRVTLTFSSLNFLHLTSISSFLPLPLVYSILSFYVAFSNVLIILFHHHLPSQLPLAAPPCHALHYLSLFYPPCLVLPLQDYEAASQMYKLAKEDFKSDKSTTHLAHATLMAAICHLITGMYTLITTTLTQLFWRKGRGNIPTFHGTQGWYSFMEAEYV
jgi:ER-Golgi trafficking TRAPP I complex 85 kDa subunit